MIKTFQYKNGVYPLIRLIKKESVHIELIVTRYTLDTHKHCESLGSSEFI